ncbi:glutamic acid-rich protein [Neltuma alba]|uniref:glutamic acid-rich protein n=1 Tax=Neltuma alba TaxID=207710 RepID=UPI0010A4E368|nr:glutamic acid-rich protein-like [Prosopis alba]
MLAMEDSTFCLSKRDMWIDSFVEVAVAVESLLAFQSLACLLVAGSLLYNINDSTLHKLCRIDGSFPLEELLKGKRAYLENKDGSETDEDDDEDDEEANDQDDDDDGEEEFSGEGEEEGNPEDDPEANGAGGSDDDDDDGEDDDGDDGEDEEEEEEEEEEEDDEEDEPPAKKRK